MNQLMQFLISHGGPALFVIVFAEQAGLPLPAAPWLLAAGALSAGGQLNAAMAIALTALAAVTADSLWFYVGRKGGQRVLSLFCRLSLSRISCVGKTKGLLARHGLQALLVAKFLPGLGTVMPPLAGALGMKTTRFLAFDTLGSLVYGSFYIGAGFLFHNQLTRLMSVLNGLGLSAMATAFVTLAGFVIYKYIRRRKLAATADQRHERPNRNDADAVKGMGVVTGGSYARANFSAGTLNKLGFQNIDPLGTPARPLQTVEARASAPLPPSSL
jgi:membrane protein DedA with SNARE-associated domain